jgi:hypothetical protein
MEEEFEKNFNVQIENPSVDIERSRNEKKGK